MDRLGSRGRAVLRSNDSIRPEHKLLHHRMAGGLSPIRRSGSPEKRSHIHDIERQQFKKRPFDPPRSQDSGIKKQKAVTFLENTPSLSSSQDTVPGSLESIASLDDIKHYLQGIMNRLDQVEENQKLILSKVETRNSDQLHDRIKELGAEIQKIKNSFSGS